MQRLVIWITCPSNMAACLDEISSQDCSASSERALSSNEWQKLQNIHQQSGFREGVSSSRDSHLQEGFVGGFRSAIQHSVTIGYMKGLISPHQQEGSKNSDADTLHGKLEQMKEFHKIDRTNATACNDGTTVEDIVKTIEKNCNSLYLQCKTLQNQSQS